jgi:CheY-like chemotaxis protein
MPIHILIIDDDPTLRECLELALAAEPHPIVQAQDAETAFTRIEELPVDLVFVNLALPGLDGREILPQLAQRLPGVTLIGVRPEAPAAAADTEPPRMPSNPCCAAQKSGARCSGVRRCCSATSGTPPAIGRSSPHRSR